MESASEESVRIEERDREIRCVSQEEREGREEEGNGEERRSASGAEPESSSSRQGTVNPFIPARGVYGHNGLAASPAQRYH